MRHSVSCTFQCWKLSTLFCFIFMGCCASEPNMDSTFVHKALCVYFCNILKSTSFSAFKILSWDFCSQKESDYLVIARWKNRVNSMSYIKGTLLFRCAVSHFTVVLQHESLRTKLVLALSPFAWICKSTDDWLYIVAFSFWHENNQFRVLLSPMMLHLE